MIGRYKLIELIDEGGMGEVWRAEQQEPVKRLVAVKLLRPEKDSRPVMARFEAERQALALMDHPNIAKIHDGGLAQLAYASGSPYFVMELVEGPTITTYCDEKRLSPRQRLELFIPVCEAIQHAHQKGIIHRDIKPSNVLIGVYDGRPVPKVIDFGVAKPIDMHLTDILLETNFGTVVGTPQYMSPEQADSKLMDIDTRTDIYSLGVLLYELLAGSPPFDKQTFAQAAIHEVLRIIREVEPPTPSTKLSHAETLTSIAANRNIEPKRLASLLRGEVDWIVMKCLEKERARRYATANALVRDIQRFLSDEPVEAGPPTVGYKLRKFIRRNRGPVIAAALVLFTLFGGIIGTSIGFYRAEQAAVTERLANDAAQRRLAQIARGNELIASIFRDLDPQAEQWEGKTLRLILGERLEQAARHLEGESVGDPLLVARLQRDLGQSLGNLGHTEKAVVLLNRVRAAFTAQLGPDHPETLAATNMLAASYFAAGRLDLAVPLFEESLALANAKLGPNHAATVAYMCHLGSAYRAAGRAARAVQLLEEALKSYRAANRLDHPDALIAANSLAIAYRSAGKPGLALPLYEESLRRSKERLGPDHKTTLSIMNNLALAYKDAGKLDLSLPLQEDVLRRMTTQLGPDHNFTISALNNVADAYRDLGKLEQALPLYQQAATAVEKRRFAHENADRIVDALAHCYWDLNQLDQALIWRHKWLAVLKERGEADSIAYAVQLESLAALLKGQKMWSEVEPLIHESLAIRQSKKPDAWTTFQAQCNLGSVLLWQKRYADAEPLIVNGYAGMKARENQIPPEKRENSTFVLRQLVQLYEEWGKPDEAEKWRKLLPQPRRSNSENKQQIR